MKTLSSLLVATLLLASANLFAQLPEEDSMINAKNKTQRDSSWSSKKNMQKDSALRSKNRFNNRDTVPGQSMRSDSAWHSNKRKIRRDTMPNGQLMQKDSTLRSDGSANRTDTVPSAQSMQYDTTASENNHLRNYAAEADSSVNKNKSSSKKTSTTTPDVSNWPQAAKLAVDEITAKYGQPDGVTEDELTWHKKGEFEKICITKNETKHSFPIEHTDMLQSTIRYDVPEDKMDDLGKFDGSITFDRTQGTMSARCDKEANNFLALNLAHDIIIGKKTTASARKTFADIIKFKTNGGNPLYMAKLTFTPKSSTGDPDTPVTAAAKEENIKTKTQKKTK